MSMFTETKSQQYLKFPHSSGKFVKSAIEFSISVKIDISWENQTK